MPNDAGGWHMGRAVRDIIKAGRLGTERAAIEFGVTPTTLYRWYRKRELTRNITERVALNYGAREEWVRTGKGAKWEGQDADSIAGDPLYRRAEMLRLMYEADLHRTTQAYTAALLKLMQGEEPHINFLARRSD
jgi:transposase-like protein